MFVTAGASSSRSCNGQDLGQAELVETLGIVAQGVRRMTERNSGKPLSSHHVEAGKVRRCSARRERVPAERLFAVSRRREAQQGLVASIVFSGDSSC